MGNHLHMGATVVSVLTNTICDSLLYSHINPKTPIFHHFDPEVGGSKFLQNIGNFLLL